MRIIFVPLVDEHPRLTQLSKPFNLDVRIWRSPPPVSELQSNIPHSVIQHSPEGFECGHFGRGPADLALNILNAFVPPRAERRKSFYEAELYDDPIEMSRGVASRLAMRWHQKFKCDFIAPMPRSGGQIGTTAIRNWIAQHKRTMD